MPISLHDFHRFLAASTPQSAYRIPDQNSDLARSKKCALPPTTKETRFMRISNIFAGICAVLACGCGNAPPAQTSQATNVVKAVPLVLEKEEGERRIVRGWPGHPDPGESFILKVDPKNGGSSHLVFMTAELAPGRYVRSCSPERRLRYSDCAVPPLALTIPRLDRDYA
jgi:hypothetical protein